MATNNSLCGLCEGLDLSEPSTSWCIDCEQSLCYNCDKRHKLIKETRSHHTIPIYQYRQLPSGILQVSQTCSTHNERYQTYCENHECPCCIECTLTTHRECKNNLPLDKIVGGVKVSNALEECQLNLEESTKNISLVIQERQQNLSQLKEQREKIQSEIRETRRKVNKHLDKIEEQLLQELFDLEESHTAEYQNLITTLEEKQKQLEKMQQNLSTLKNHATDLQVFLEIKKMEKMSLLEEEYIEKLRIDGKLSITTMEVELNQTLRAIEKSIPTFGHLSVKLRPWNVVLQKKKYKQAQLHVPNVRSIDSMGLDLIQSMNVNKKGLFGCCFLPDGRYALASRNENCIEVMKENGTKDFQINVKPCNIVDITHILSTNTLAATTGGDGGRYINIIDIDTRRITRSILSNSANYGITYHDLNLYYCAGKVGICKMNLKDGKETTMKSIPNMSLFSYIALHRDNLYYTNHDAQIVTCCSIEGAIRWEFKDTKVLSSPVGLSVDNNGNVFVLGYATDNLVVLSPDGSRHFELLLRKDGLFSPCALYFDKIHNQLLLTNRNTKMFLYKLK